MKPLRATVRPPSLLRARGVPVHGRSQHGVMLLEALIAVVIFSLGVLALIGLQSVAIREITESKARADASYLADKILGDLSTMDIGSASAIGSSLLTDFTGTYTATAEPATADVAVYGVWQTMLARTLPDGSIILAVDSAPDALGTSSVNAATITVQWRVASGDLRTFSQTARLVD